MTTDERMVYGANCAWWDGIEKIGRIPSRSVPGTSIPCCPHCRGMLFEFPTLKDWWDQVDRYAKMNGEPEYRAFVEWWRGKHFRNVEEARAAYDAGAADRPGRVAIKPFKWKGRP